MKTSKRILDFFWNAWCILSLIGIWPRFIESKLLSISRISVPIPHLPQSLDGIKILQLSDLHLKPSTPDWFLNRIVKKVKLLNPDLIVFTGDFLCRASLAGKERLQHFLSAFDAPYGCFAILGNHDYQKYVTINEQGDYDVYNDTNPPIARGLKRLSKLPVLTKNVTEKARRSPQNHELNALLQKTPFQLLHNTSKVIEVNKSFINICGLGEHMLGQCLPKQAFQHYNKSFPGIILTHNPDSIEQLKECPGDLILCGHTHGGQVNLPFLCNRFMLLENPRLKRGLFKINNKWLYVNRGLGSVMSFRWFSKPEIALLTLRQVKT